MREIDGKLEGLKTSTIMIVDDEPTTIDVLEAFLQGEGYSNFLTTDDSRRALGLLASEGADVVLLDLNMPHVGGFEILEAIRGDDVLKYTPVIILTSATEPQTKLKALELGATDFLGKPVDSSELALRLRNTLAAKAYQDQLVYYDGVTGLPNRRSFTERTGRALQRARHDAGSCALLHIALGQFERISNTLGHRVGDELLGSVARRLEQCVRATDIVGAAEKRDRRSVSRIGNDEFAIFLPAGATAEAAAAVARRVIADVSEPFSLNGSDLFVTCTVGIALSPEDGDEIETLLRHARLCNSKRSTHSDYTFYSRSLNEESVERLSLENQLRGALDRDEMVLHYQPQVDVETGKIVGTEALMRWQHPELGLVAPNRFIPIAEEAGLITALGAWAVRTACRQSMAFQAAGLPAIRMSVNASSQQFLHGDLVTTVHEALQETGLSPELLVIELTEGMIMENPHKASLMLEQMTELGVGISVDDFGTGYSALSHLKRFPLQELKIDRSFVSGIPGDSDDAAIVSAIVAMAHSLGLRVLAEGVETREQLAFMQGKGCDEFQGFLFSRGLPARELAEFLAGTAEG